MSADPHPTYDLSHIADLFDVADADIDEVFVNLKASVVALKPVIRTLRASGDSRCVRELLTATRITCDGKDDFSINITEVSP